jgi:hypothetical protein
VHSAPASQQCCCLYDCSSRPPQLAVLIMGRPVNRRLTSPRQGGVGALCIRGCLFSPGAPILTSRGSHRLSGRSTKSGVPSSKRATTFGASLARDRKRKAKTVAPKGQGDRGDRKRA